MEFGLSQEQEFLRDTLTKFLADHAGLPRARRFADGGERRAQDLWAGLVELGLPGLTIGETHGGVGLTTLDAATMAQALGSAIAPAPFIATAVLVPRAIARAGTPDQQSEWLPRLASGEIIAGAAISEAGSGAREGAKVTARAGRLSGKALFVLDYEADVYLVADASHRLYLVDANAHGLTRRALTTIDTTRPTGELLFDAAAAQVLPGSEDPAVLADLLDVGRVLLAADSLGAAQNMLQQAVSYSLSREQFGRPIGSFQAVKHLCAEMAAGLEPCQALVWYAAYAIDAEWRQRSPRDRVPREGARCRSCEVRRKNGHGSAWRHGFHRSARPTLLVQAHRARPAIARQSRAIARGSRAVAGSDRVR